MKKALLILLAILWVSQLVIAQRLELTPTIFTDRPVVKNGMITKIDKTQLVIGQSSPSINMQQTGTSILNYSWSKYLSTYYNDRFYASSIDNNGNSISVGSIGAGSSDTDAFIYKCDAMGNELWSKKPAISSYIDGIYDVTTDQSGNIFITGKFNGSAFDGWISSNGSGDVFVAKYAPDGNLIWANRGGGYDEDYGCGIKTDGNGNVYVVGFFNGTATFNDTYITSSSQGDMFIAKYDGNSGDIVWIQTGDIGANNYLYGIGVDLTGNVYVGTVFSGSVSFSGSPVVSSVGEDDMLLIKYNTNGNFQWIKTGGGTGDDGINRTVVCPDGSILVGGFFSGTAQFGEKTLTSHGTYDIFAAKYSPAGNLVWAKQFGGTGSQSAWGVGTDEKNNCYLTGWFTGTGAFDNTTVYSSGNADAYLIKYDKNGNLIWVESIATGDDDQYGSRMAVAGNDIILAGRYHGDSYIYGNYFANEGGEDGFIVKLTQSDNLITSIVNPSFSLSSSQIKQGQSITITGKQFSPYGKYDLHFSGPDNIASFRDESIDINGNFQKIITTSSSIIIGDYKITAIDKVSGKTYSRTFRILSNQTNIVDNDLIITEPNVSKTRYLNQPLSFAWQDKVKFNVNPLYNYKHSYSVYVQKDNGSWQSITKVEGSNKGFGSLDLSISYIPESAGTYKLKVEDNYYSNRSATSPEIIIETPINDDISIDYKWDRSYPLPEINNPVGVAADGVARIYLVISNKNPLGAPIQKVKINLSDINGYMAPRYLGKLKYCSIQNDNSTNPPENDFNSIMAENNTSNLDGKYWFWYVAPDDFSRNEGDWAKESRIINVNFDITLTDGKKFTKEGKIEIVRPPLFLVHGLNGEWDETWENFRIGSGNPVYSKDERFKNTFAPQMEKTAAFDFNSNLLLDNVNNERSFMYRINQLREKGYASNQVDYLCHSMGGSILRNAAEKTNSFYRNANYYKGFVHKFITLNTPHQGSSLANLLDDITMGGLLTSLITIPASFDKLAKLYQDFPPRVVDAVKDLEYKGGKKFGITQIPSHLIGSGVSCNDYNTKTKGIYLALKNYLALITFTNLNPFGFCNWFHNYFSLFKYESDFMDGNDAIVSLTSQFSGNLAGTLPTYCTRVDGPMHNSIFGESPTKSEDVFDKVEELLNSDVESSLFSSLRSTIETKSADISPDRTINVIENKINIRYPSTTVSYNAGDTMIIKLNVDTLGLKSFALFFQDQAIYDLPSNPSVSISLNVNPEQIEGQNIVAIGNYQIDGQSSVATASRNIKVNPVTTITELNINPEVIVLQKGKSTRPAYEAVFPNAIATIGVTDLLSVTIKDPSVLSYSAETNSFTGIEAGTTDAIVNYRGKSKTIFFEILQAVTPPYDPPTGLNNFDINVNQSKIKVYPNPVTDQLTIEYAGSAPFDITNAQGQVIFNGVITEKITISTSGYSPGMYFIKFYSDKLTESQKFIKK